MISTGEYVKVLLKKRNMRQIDLLEKMKEYKLANEKTLIKQKLNNAINIQMGYTWARRIELALDLPDYTIVRMIGTPSEKDWKRIKEVQKHV